MEALKAALAVFQEKGFDAASMTDLTEAMGINKPSLYAAFGDKKALFGKALELYTADANAEAMICDCEDVREAVRRFLIKSASTAHGNGECSKGTPASEAKRGGGAQGCMLVIGGLTGGEESACIRDRLAAVRQEIGEAWQHRFEREKAKGQLPADLDPVVLARWVMTIQNGMSVQAKTGATQSDLERVAEFAMRAWPSPGRE